MSRPDISVSGLGIGYELLEICFMLFRFCWRWFRISIKFSNSVYHSLYGCVRYLPVGVVVVVFVIAGYLLVIVRKAMNIELLLFFFVQLFSVHCFVCTYNGTPDPQSRYWIAKCVKNVDTKCKQNCKTEWIFLFDWRMSQQVSQNIHRQRQQDPSLKYTKHSCVVYFVNVIVLFVVQCSDHFTDIKA